LLAIAVFSLKSKSKASGRGSEAKHLLDHFSPLAFVQVKAEHKQQNPDEETDYTIRYENGSRETEYIASRAGPW